MFGEGFSWWQNLFGLVCAGGPPLIILGYFYWLDRFQADKDSVGIILGIGAVASFIALASGALERPQGDLIEKALLSAFTRAAIPEEGIKFVILLWFVRSQPIITRHHEIVLFGVAFSMGFSAIENILYLSSRDDWAAIALLRALMSSPSHAFCGAIMGGYIALSNIRSSRDWAAKPLGIATVGLSASILLHGAYDFPLMLYSETDDHGLALEQGTGLIAISAVVIVLVLGGIWSHLLSRRIRVMDKSAIQSV